MDIERAIDDEYTMTANLGRVEIPEQMKPYIIELLALRKELLQYRQIGTVDECMAAMEKQIPQKPEMIEAQSQGLIGDGTHTNQVSYQSDAYECPKCGSFLGFKTDCCDDENYQDCFCSACGQALKWED